MTDPREAAAFDALLGQVGEHLFVIVDEGLRIVRAGPEAAAIADRDEAALAGMSLIAAFGSAPLDAVARQAATTATPASGEAALGHLGRRLFAVDAIPLDDGGLVLSLHETTELRRAERVRRDFIANIGHELRTPLSSIKLLAETLSSGGVDEPATMREFATQIEREIDHLAQLVDELLDLSTIESGETQLRIEQLDPAAVTRAVAERIGPMAERRGIRIVEVPSGDAGVRAVADPDRLEQAILNLAHNAVKFSQSRGEVRIGWSAGDGTVRFSVADDGIGIPDGHKARIFERFYKVDRSRTRDRASGAASPSAGLGLSIVRHIAEAHGGSVGVTSEEGVGSTFWIEVPRA